jgi:hypothetical protein
MFRLSPGTALLAMGKTFPDSGDSSSCPKGDETVVRGFDPLSAIRRLYAFPKPLIPNP